MFSYSQRDAVKVITKQAIVEKARLSQSQIIY